MKRMTAALCLALTLPALPAAASEKTFQKIKIEAGEKAVRGRMPPLPRPPIQPMPATARRWKT
ncbi:hypothetical protein ACFOHS_08265 [Jhaorihella thermophila]